MTQNRRRFDVAYLGIWPIAHKSEGLNVLLCDTLRPLIEDNVEVVIHTTDRHAPKIVEALEGNGINTASITITAYPVGSVVLRGLHHLNRRKDAKRVKRNFLEQLFFKVVKNGFKVVEVVLLWALDLTRFNWVLKFPVSAVLIVLITLISLLIGSIVGVATLFFGLPVFFAYKITKLAIIFRRSKLNLIRKFRARLRISYVKLRTNLVPHLFEKEQLRFADALNKQKLVKSVFFFTAFEGYAVQALNKRKVVVFPDAVTYLYPLRFAQMLVSTQMLSLRMAVTHANGIICYSEFVRDAQLRCLFPEVVKSKSVEVIPQGYFIPIDSQSFDKQDAQRRLGSYTSLVKNLFPQLLVSPPQLNFGQFEYILYPTIDRPHKNTTTLIKAFSLLLRKRHLNLKLILTSPHATSDVYELIVRERLQYDVIFMPSVPLNVLNLLFEGAALMVHPSLAEGGDIFNFSRAVSSRCPALLADVPVVREMFEREQIDALKFAKWLFDPVDFQALALAIVNALDSREKLVADQGLYLSRVATYDFRKMAHRYLEFIDKV